jgi:hypothetical protein
VGDRENSRLESIASPLEHVQGLKHPQASSSIHPQAFSCAWHSRMFRIVPVVNAAQRKREIFLTAHLKMSNFQCPEKTKVCGREVRESRFAYWGSGVFSGNAPHWLCLIDRMQVKRAFRVGVLRSFWCAAALLQLSSARLFVARRGFGCFGDYYLPPGVILGVAR